MTHISPGGENLLLCRCYLSCWLFSKSCCAGLQRCFVLFKIVHVFSTGVFICTKNEAQVGFQSAGCVAPFLDLCSSKALVRECWSIMKQNPGLPIEARRTDFQLGEGPVCLCSLSQEISTQQPEHPLFITSISSHTLYYPEIKV